MGHPESKEAGGLFLQRDDEGRGFLPHRAAANLLQIPEEAFRNHDEAWWSEVHTRLARDNALAPLGLRELHIRSAGGVVRRISAESIVVRLLTDAREQLGADTSREALTYHGAVEYTQQQVIAMMDTVVDALNPDMVKDANHLLRRAAAQQIGPDEHRELWRLSSHVFRHGLVQSISIVEGSVGSLGSGLEERARFQHGGNYPRTAREMALVLLEALTHATFKPSQIGELSSSVLKTMSSTGTCRVVAKLPVTLPQGPRRTRGVSGMWFRSGHQWTHVGILKNGQLSLSQSGIAPLFHMGHSDLVKDPDRYPELEQWLSAAFGGRTAGLSATGVVECRRLAQEIQDQEPWLRGLGLGMHGIALLDPGQLTERLLTEFSRTPICPGPTERVTPTFFAREGVFTILRKKDRKPLGTLRHGHVLLSYEGAGGLMGIHPSTLATNGDRRDAIKEILAAALAPSNGSATSAEMRRCRNVVRRLQRKYPWFAGLHVGTTGHARQTFVPADFVQRFIGILLAEDPDREKLVFLLDDLPTLWGLKTLEISGEELNAAGEVLDQAYEAPVPAVLEKWLDKRYPANRPHRAQARQIFFSAAQLKSRGTPVRLQGSNDQLPAPYDLTIIEDAAEVAAGLEESGSDPAAHPVIAEAQRRVGLGQWTDALTALESAITAQPNNLELVIEHADLLISLGRALEATVELTTMLNREPENIRALIKRGNAYRAQKEFDRAVQDVNRALALESTNVKAWGTLAKIHRLQDRDDDALAAVETALRLDSTYTPGLVAKGELLFKKRKLMEASQCIASLTPEDDIAKGYLPAYILKIKILKVLGDTVSPLRQQAEALAMALIAGRPQDVRLLMTLFEIYTDSDGHLDRSVAGKLAAPTLEAYPRAPEKALGKMWAAVLHALGRHSEAIDALKDYMQGFPFDRGGNILLQRWQQRIEKTSHTGLEEPPQDEDLDRSLQEARQAMTAHRWSEAEQAWSRVLAHTPPADRRSHAMAHMSRAKARMALRQLAAVIADCTAVIRLNGRLNSYSAPAFYLRAQANTELRQLHYAQEDWKNFIVLRDRAERPYELPRLARLELANAYRERARVLARLGHLDSARTSARNALSVNPEDPGSYITLADIESDIGEYELAHIHATTALEIVPESSSAWLAHARAELGLGRAVIAESDAQEALRLDPDKSYAKYVLMQALEQQHRWEEAAGLRRQLERRTGLEEWGLRLSLGVTQISPSVRSTRWPSMLSVIEGPNDDMGWYS